MSASLAPQWIFQALTDAGDVASGAQLHSFIAGGGSIRSPLLGEDGVTPLDNPYIFNSAGRGKFLLDDAVSYRLRLETATGALIEERDNVFSAKSSFNGWVRAADLAEDADPSKGAGLVGYKGRTVRDRLQQGKINVFELLTPAQINSCLAGTPNFDITPILSSAATSAVSAGFLPQFFFPRATYRMSTKLVLSSGCVMDGDYPIILCGVSNDYTIESNGYSGTNTGLKTAFRNIIFKWNGVFGASTAGGINIISGTAVEIARCVFWGLGGSAIRTGRIAQRIEIFGNQFMEHLNTSDIAMIDGIGADNDIYTPVIRENLFQFTGSGRVKAAVISQASFNLEISGNAFERCIIGVSLAPRGACRQGIVENNFFEDCIIGLSLGAPQADAYLGFIDNVGVNFNHFTTCDTGVRVAGACTIIDISKNAFSGMNASHVDGAMIPIDITSKQSAGVVIGPNEYGTTPYASRAVGNVYPWGVSAVDCAEVAIDANDNLTGWSTLFNPSGLGNLALANGFPGSRRNALRLFYSPGTPDQYSVRKTISAVDLSTVDTFVVLFRVNDPLFLQYQSSTNPALTSWNLAMGPNASNYWQFPMQNFSNGRTRTLHPGWNIVMFKKADAVIAAGAPASWAAITYLVLRVVPQTGTAPDVSFGGVYGYAVRGAISHAVARGL